MKSSITLHHDWVKMKIDITDLNIHELFAIFMKLPVYMEYGRESITEGIEKLYNDLQDAE